MDAVLTRRRVAALDEALHATNDAERDYALGTLRRLAHYGPGFSATAQQPRVSTARCHQYCGAMRPAISAQSARVVVRTELATARVHGFEWVDAAIGFGIAYGTMLLAAGAFVVKRRAGIAPAG